MVDKTDMKFRYIIVIKKASTGNKPKEENTFVFDEPSEIFDYLKCMSFTVGRLVQVDIIPVKNPSPKLDHEKS